MRRLVVFAAALTVMISGLVSGPVSRANAESGPWGIPPIEDPRIDYTQPLTKLAVRSPGPTLRPTPQTHDPFKSWGGVSGATLTSTPHCPGTRWLCIDYAASAGADTVVWTNNKGLTGTVTQYGAYPLYQGKRASDGHIYQPTDAGGCPGSISTGELWTFSHNEYAAHVEASYTDGVGSPWTFIVEYWHMGSVSTGSKTSGSSIGAQAVHTIGGCKFYSWGALAATGAHIHHQGWDATTYTSSPIAVIWTGVSH